LQSRIVARIAVLLCLLAMPASGQTPRAATSAQAGPAQADPVQKIEIQAQAIEAFDPRDPARTRFGSLQFRGGLVLTSTSKDFGGISSLKIGPDGARFIAASDKANWLRGRVVYRDGKPIAIDEAEMAPMLGPDGRPLAKRGWYDTESMAEDGGTIYVGIERVHEIVRFDYGRFGLRARGQPVPGPAALKSLPSNKGLECLAMPAKGQPLAGTLIAISERGLDSAGNILGFLIGGASPGSFTVKRTDEFEVSDCAVTPRGDLLILERRFSWTRGVAMRIRRIPLVSVVPGTVLGGPEVVFADMGYQIDNMEGLSVHAGAGGALVLTLISDDNFSPIQRTVLLQFTLVEEE
jgi:hypothetical protein